MSSTNRRFIIAYIFLVGLPLAGLAGVLKTGRHLSAPISIDGTWKVDANVRPSADACSQSISSLLNSSLTISQSGRSLVLSFNGGAKTPFTGSLEGKEVNASLGAASGCSGDQSVTLKASVDPASEPRMLTGSLSTAGCSSCSPIEFRAVRQPRQPGGIR
jgi:hypothetical protein